MRTYDNIKKNSINQGDGYTTGCLLDYNYFKERYKRNISRNMIAIDWRKQKELDSDAETIQQINFTGNLENQSTIFFITEEAKQTVLDFSQGTVKAF